VIAWVPWNMKEWTAAFIAGQARIFPAHKIAPVTID